MLDTIKSGILSTTANSITYYHHLYLACHNLTVHILHKIIYFTRPFFWVMTNDRSRFADIPRLKSNSRFPKILFLFTSMIAL